MQTRVRVLNMTAKLTKQNTSEQTLLAFHQTAVHSCLELHFSENEFEGFP